MKKRKKRERRKRRKKKMPYHRMRFISRERKIKHGQQKQSIKRERKREKQGKRKQINRPRAGNTYLLERDRGCERASERETDRQSNLKTYIAKNRSLQ